MIPRAVESLDPRFITDPYGIKVSRLIHRSLFTIDPHTLDVVGDLAIDHRFVEDTVLEVELDPSARFSDGSILDADDVLATLAGLVDPEVASVYAGTFRRIVRRERLSAHRIRLHLEGAHATLLTDLEVPILRSEDAARERTREGFIGAGPYALVAWQGAHLRLRRVQGDGPELVQFIVLRDDNGRALRLQAEEADVALNAIPHVLLPVFEEDARFVVRDAPGIGTSYLGFRTDEGLFADLRLRQAIAHAIDVDALIDAKLGGHARPASSWVPLGHWADAGLARPAYDPVRARELVREAGALGRTVSLRTSSDRARVSICRAIAAMLHQVGLNVHVHPSESATLIADLNAGRFELTYLQVPEVFEPHVLHWFFASERIPEGAGGANRWRVRDHELDAALERGRTSLSIEERRQAYEFVQRRLAERLPVLPLWQPSNVAVFRRGAEGRVPRDGRFRAMLRGD